MDKINFSPDNIEKLFQQAVDEAIEQHRIKGESIAISENGKVKIVTPEEITPLKDKLRKRKVYEQPHP
ncbi:hypothetical protein [Pleurocapsa sp. FMAR1]|uniref:hypothetical protein n=1 Tax=Pleurocapsa sp. FMAR1 TaxID=3040204 RepID=UPI0029C7A6CF|nr:hypothetical protein [Pleurocapsa sp. FMAR1]